MTATPRRLWLVSLVAAVALLVAACADDADDADDADLDEEPAEVDEPEENDEEDDEEAEAAADDELPFEGETLTVLNWNDYGSDQDYAIEGFKERTGASVEHVYHSGGEELRQILRTGGVGEIDVALPNPTYVQQMQEEGTIQPVDTSQIPNLELVADTFIDVEDIYVDGELYGVPWVWGSTGLTYNTEHFDEEPTSWGVLWDSEWEDRVGFMDSPVEAVMLTALYLGDDPHDPDLDAVRDALIEMRPNVQIYWGSSDDWTRAFTTEAISVGNFWAGDAGSMMEEGHPVGYTIPEEGAAAWLSTWSIVADAPNPDLAHAWIDWMISTDFLLTWAEDPLGNAPAPATTEAQEQLSEEAKERTQAYPDQVDDLAIMGSLTEEQQQAYTDLLAEVKAGAQ